MFEIPARPRKPFFAFQKSNTGKDSLALKPVHRLSMDRYTKMTTGCLPVKMKTFLRLRHAEVRERLTKAILLLPEPERLVFTLHYCERLTTEEMKQVLGVTESSISRLHLSGLSRLQASLEDRADHASLVVTKAEETIQ
jgi:DNA-directed RNA polymerase specialized sigma subunit